MSTPDDLAFIAEAQRTHNLGLKYKIPVSVKVLKDGTPDVANMSTGYARLEKVLDNVKSSLDNIATKADESGISIDLEKVLNKAMEPLEKRYRKSLDTDGLKAIAEAKEEFLKQHITPRTQSSGVAEVSFGEAKEIKKIANEDLAKAYESERPAAYKRAQLEMNKSLLSEMVEALTDSGISEVRLLAKPMRAKGLEMRSLINLRSILLRTKATLEGADPQYYAWAAGGKMLRMKTPGVWETAVTLRGILGPERKSLLGLRLTGAYKPAKGRAAINVAAAIERATGAARGEPPTAVTGVGPNIPAYPETWNTQ